METCAKNLEKFVDFDQCLSYIDEIDAKTGDHIDLVKSRADSERLVEQFRKTVDKYQEQPELLEPSLPELIQRLTCKLSNLQKSSNKYETIFKFLYQLIKVTGFKSIGKKFPHETDKLPLLLELLAEEDRWQTRYVLTVWLSIVILTPFDLAKFDSSPSNAPETDTASQVYSTLLRSLSNHDSCQHVTAYCLAKFFSRPDAGKHLNAFVVEALAELAAVKTTVASSTDDVKLIGYLRTLAYVFKFLPRDKLKQQANLVLETIAKLEKIDRELVNHLLIKLVQRVGLALLPKRVAAWRYKRGCRILGQEKVATASATEPVATNCDSLDKSNDNDEVDEVDASSLAERLESILSMLFVAAQNSQTKIRWSAAKGVARIASRLSRERASDVIDLALANFFDANSSNEFAWHGGCLMLAEMSRNGLILEERLAEVINIVGRAIIYDKIKGTFAVGAHVREAACYVLWAMSRTYEDRLIRPYVSSISVNLLCTMIFDRELQCRRAAAATFQELIGRQGTFNDEEISILTNVDYQNVGQRQFAYLELALRVASHGQKYSEPFIKHLIDKKIGHWDIQIRRLASDSLGALMLHAASHEFIGEQVIDPLCKASNQTIDQNLKHGAILGLSRVIKSLVPLGFGFEQDLVDFVGSLANNCEKQLKSKQQAPIFMEAIASIVLAAEAATFRFSSKNSDEILAKWESIVLTTLDSDTSSLREIGSDALLSLYCYFYSNNKTSQDRLLTVLNTSLSSLNESTRCGALRSLSKLGRSSVTPAGYLPVQAGVDSGVQEPTSGSGNALRIKLDADTPDIILMSLTGYVGKDTREKLSGGAGGGGELVFAQAKAEACESLVNFLKSLDKSRLVVCTQWLRLAYEALLTKSEDYTFDKRGDIGVVVRKAAVKGLEELTLFLLSINLGSAILAEQRLITALVSRILQQAVSYHNSARELAAQAFYKLICSSDLLQEQFGTTVPHRGEILDLFDRFQANDEFNWRDDSTQIFVKLLTKQEYSSDLWIGLLPAVGQASDLCAKQFRDALKEFIVSLQEQDRRAELDLVFESYLVTLERRNLPQRLITAGLNTADYLLNQGLLEESSGEFQERLAEFSWQQARQPSAAGAAADPKRLVSVGRVLSSMLQFPGRVQLDSLKHCLELLASGFARVRVCIAEQLYLSLMTYQAELEQTLSEAPGQAAAIASTEDGQLGDSVASVDCVHRQPDDCKQQSPAQSANAPSRDLLSGSSRTSFVSPTSSGATGAAAEVNLEAAMELLSQTNWSEPLEKVRPIQLQVRAHLLAE